MLPMPEAVDIYDPFRTDSSVNHHEVSPTLYCVDDFYCTSFRLTLFRSIAIGWLALLTTTACVIFNLVFLSGLANRALRSTPTIYLSAIIIADTLRQILYAVIHILPALPTNEKEQSAFYHSSISFVVPQLIPLIDTFTTFISISLLSCMCVLIKSNRLKQRDSSLQKCDIQSEFPKPSRLHRPRRVVLITIGLIATLFNIPMFFKFKLLEVDQVKGLDERKGVVYGRIIQTSLYANRKHIFDGYLVALKVSIWLATMVCFWIIWRNLHRQTDEVDCTSDNGWTANHLRLDRRRMEVLMTLYYVVLWLLSSLAQILELIYHLISSVHSDSVWLLASLNNLGSWTIGTSEFCVVYLAVLRSVSYVITGVYVRRMLNNMYKHYVWPGKRQSLTHLSDLYISSQMTSTRNWDPVPGQGLKLSCSSSMVPLMFSSKSYGVLQDKLNLKVSRVQSEILQTQQLNGWANSVQSNG